MECFLTTLYDSFWPIILWLAPLLLHVSVSECLTLTDIGRNPLQHPTPLLQWEVSCGLALPPDRPTMKESANSKAEKILFLFSSTRAKQIWKRSKLDD
jgi:hypothetical protein